LLLLFVSWISDEGAGTTVSNYPKQIPRYLLAFNVRACVAARTLLLRLTEAEAAQMYNKDFYSSIMDERMFAQCMEILADQITSLDYTALDNTRSIFGSEKCELLKDRKRNIENLPLGISQETDSALRRKN
jgi:hypothetical protein